MQSGNFNNKKRKHGEIYNIGNDQEIKIEKLIKLICSIMKKILKNQSNMFLIGHSMISDIISHIIK